MPTFNTVAERDAYLAQKLKNAGVAPATNFSSSSSYNQVTKNVANPVVPAPTATTKSDGSWINSTTKTPTSTKTPTMAETTAPGADNGAWITTRPTQNTTATPATTTTQDTTLNIPTETPSKIETVVTAAQTQADKDQEAKDRVQADYHKLWAQGEEDVKNGIYATNPYPESYSEYRKQQSGELQKQVDFSKQQNEIANKVEEAQLGISTKQGKSAISGVQAGMAQSREGVVGTSKPLAATSFTNTQNTIINNAVLQVQSAKNARDEAQRQLELAKKTGDAKAIEIYGGQVAQANADITSAQTDLATAQNKASETALDWANKGFLDGASDEDITALSSSLGVPAALLKVAANASTKKGLSDEAKTQMDNLSTFTDMVSKGVSFNLNTLNSISQSTGLDVGTLANISQLGAQVSTTKGIEQQKAQADLTSAIAEANQKQRGIFTAAQQNTDYLSQLYRTGASSDVISAFKSAAGITDVNDPKYKAELKYKQAEAAIEEAHSEGRAITPDDMAKLADAQEEINYINGAGSNPSPGGEELANVALNYKTTGDWKSDFKNNKVYQGGNLGCAVVASGILKQAGVLDKKYPSIATLIPALQKEGWTRVDTPQKGDVVVWGPMQGTDGHGHVGVCTSGTMAVNNQGPSGPANTLIFTGRTVKPSADYPLAGFYRPPGNVQMADKPEQTSVYSDTMAALRKQNVPFDTAKSIATQATKDAYNASKTTEEAPEIKSVAEDAANGLITYSQMISGAGKESVKYKAAFSKAIQAKADEESDPLAKKMILSRAKGDPDASTDQSWSKAASGFNQVLDLKDTLDRLTSQGKTGIINGRINELNVLDEDVATLKRQITGLVPTIARGTFGEVGVLTDKDIEHYTGVIGDMKSTPKQIDDATSNLIKVIYRNYTSGISSSPKNTSNRIDEYKSLKDRLPQNIKDELGVKDYSEAPAYDWTKAMGQGVANLLQNNLNTESSDNNPWNNINTTQDTDILGNFDAPKNKWMEKLTHNYTK